MANLLVIDDDPMLLEAMEAILSAEHRVRAVGSGQMALEAFRAEQPEMVISDLVMPDMTGLELLEKVRATPGGEGVPFMFISAIDEPQIERRMAAVGAEAFLRKPFDAEVLTEAVSARLKRAEEFRLAESRRAYLSAIELLADIIEARDAYTHEHTGRVRRFALLLGECLGWSERQLEVLGLVALLHDIGKIAIPDAILRKAGPLTAEEATVMRLHPVVGYDILQRVPYLAGAASGVRGHHERWDGQGYPDKLAGDNIPLEARIVTIADTFDAITTDRPYRQARSVELALAELERESGRQFDPALVALFTQHTERVAELAGLSPL